MKTNTRIEYFIEDKIARNLLLELGAPNTKALSCVTPSDVTFSQQYPSLFEMPEYIVQEYDSAEKYLYDVERKYVVSPALIKEGKEVYLKKRADTAKKRLRLATDKYLSEKKCVIQFRANSNMDRTTPLRETITTGDGRLCIEVDIENGLCTTYYGGVYIPEDMIEQILSM